MFFGFLITNLPFHVVTLKSALSASVKYAILKYKTDLYIKEMIILGIFTVVKFTTYYDPLTPSWEVVDNIISSF